MMTPGSLSLFQVEDMIWEVDEDCDHAVSWDEFKLMFHRCRNDRTGLEPRKLFNVVEFMMHDKVRVAGSPSFFSSPLASLTTSRPSLPRSSGRASHVRAACWPAIG